MKTEVLVDFQICISVPLPSPHSLGELQCVGHVGEQKPSLDQSKLEKQLEK